MLFLYETVPIKQKKTLRSLVQTPDYAAVLAGVLYSSHACVLTTRQSKLHTSSPVKLVKCGEWR